MQGTSLAGRLILIVEDEALIALDITLAFEQVGAVVLTAPALADALRFIEQDGLSAAVLDFGLRDGDTGALCGRLKERQIPFVLHSGYEHASDACHGGAVVPKPANPAKLIEAVLGLL